MVPPTRAALPPAGNGGSEQPTQPPMMASCPKALPSGFVWSLDRSTDVGRAMLAATRRLREEGCDSPQLDSAVLMMHVLGVNKAWVYAHPHQRLAETEISRYESLVRRRICHEPIAYLVGRKAFFGLELIVQHGVLIPRPETELLVERALDHIRQLARQGRSTLVADIGAGSGAIAVALAVNAPDVEVFAVDLSAEALAVARQNIERHGVAAQVRLLSGNLTDPLPAPVDVIVANLPYVATPQLAALPPTVRDYEPTAALDGGPDGLQVFRAFFDGLARAGVHAKLRPGGRLFLEIGADQGQAVKALAELALPGAEVVILPDYAGLDRIVVAAT